jgi:hypothetical protein
MNLVRLSKMFLNENDNKARIGKYFSDMFLIQK